MTRLLAGAAFLVLLAGCQPPASPPANESAVAVNGAPEPAPTVRAPDNAALPEGGLAAWLVGSWSFEKECATDFAVHYNADGSLENSGDGGRWALAGETVTETITERFEMGGDAPEKVDPPETRAYSVERVDQNHGVLTFQGKKIPILRC